jgi:transposase-like protein
MVEPASAQDLFKGRHFDREIIILCVRWYLTFKVSSRDLVQMMAERGIALAHTTVGAKLRRIKQRIRPMLGFKRFETAAVTIRGIELAAKIKKHNSTSNSSPAMPPPLRKSGPRC